MSEISLTLYEICEIKFALVKGLLQINTVNKITIILLILIQSNEKIINVAITK
jgi:hypothetical protein